MNNTNLIPLKDFFKNPEQTDFALSKNGKYIASLKPWKKRLNIFIQKISPERVPYGDSKQVTFAQDRDICYFIWKGDNNIVYFKDSGGDENFCPFAVDIDSGKEQSFINAKNVRVDLLDSLDEVSDTEILIQGNQRDSKLFDIYRLNIITGNIRMVAKNFGNVSFWCVDHAGEVRIALQSDGLTTKIYSRSNESDEFKQIFEFDYTYDSWPLLFTADNKFVYFAYNLSRDKRAIVKIDPVNGKEIEEMFSHPDVDVGILKFSKKRKLITEIIYTTWKKEHKVLDQKMQDVYKNLHNIVGDKVISLPSSNYDEDLFVALVTDDKTDGTYYLYDSNNNKLTFLAEHNPSLPKDKLASMRPIQYNSRDGLTINGYLTLPNNANKNLPVVVIPHGGPWSRDIWGYDAEVQFLANRGYAVLQMNFRSSIGYGREFYIKGFKQWGRAMQDDITDGVMWLIAQGIADPKRIAIYGCSYGGYAALCGVTLTPELYCCAIDYVGVANLFTFMDMTPPYWDCWKEQQLAMIGDPENEREYLEAVSPVHNADKIIAPLMVAQGANDPRVNIYESNQIVDALNKRGIDVEYMVKDNEGHGFLNEENRLELYEAMEKFLAKHMV